MTDSRGRIIWRVRRSDSAPQAAAFDALILASAREDHEALRPSRLIGGEVPFERELPDVGLTLIVRSTSPDAVLVSECDVFNADGSRRVYGRSANPLAVFVCSDRGILVTGLPAPDARSDSLDSRGDG